MTETINREVAVEAARQEESCLYTSTSMFLWLRSVRKWRAFMTVAPILLGGIAGLSLAQSLLPSAAIIVLTFLASLFPALDRALKIESNVELISSQAAQFKSLQDRFRRIKDIYSLKSPEVAESALEEAMVAMDQARSASITPSEKYFEKARKKIEAGDYSFSVDNEANSNTTQK